MTSLLNGWPDGALSDLATWITREYDLQGRHPDRGALYQHYADLSQALRAARPCKTLRYGTGDRCAIDYFAADNTAGQLTPLFIFLHGGFWRGGERANFHAIAAPLLDAGISAAFVGYELAPAVTLTELYQQVRMATDLLFSQAGALGFDRTRVNLCGHSAGGHLVTLLASESSYGAVCPFDNVIPISGIFSLEPMLLSPINHLVRITTQEIDTLSPMVKRSFHANRFEIVVGDGETDSFLAQSSRFHQHLLALGRDAHLHQVLGHHHFSIFQLFLDPRAPFLERLIRQMQYPQ